MYNIIHVCTGNFLYPVIFYLYAHGRTKLHIYLRRFPLLSIYIPFTGTFFSLLQRSNRSVALGDDGLPGVAPADVCPPALDVGELVGGEEGEAALLGDDGAVGEVEEVCEGEALFFLDVEGNMIV